MSVLKELMDTAVDEAKGRATPEQRRRLEEDVDAWRDALHAVLDDLDHQAERNGRSTERRCVEYPTSAAAERSRYAAWLARTETFRSVIERRIAGLEFETAVRRRRRLDEAHRQLAAVVAELVDIDLDDLEFVPEVVVSTADLVEVQWALQELLDAAAGMPAGVLVGADS